MNAERKAMLFALSLGLVFWLLDSLVDYHSVPLGTPFVSSLLPLHGPSVILRLVTVSLFLLFGSVTARVLRQRRLAQAALRDSRSRLEQMFHGVPDAMWELDVDGRIMRVNRQLEVLLGLPPDRIVGKTCHRLIKTRRCGTGECPLQRALCGEECAETELVVERGDGQQAICLVNAEALCDQQGGPSGIVEAFTNLTEMRAAEARFQALVETTGDAVTIIDPKGQIVYANQAFCRTLEYPCEEIIGRQGADFCDTANQVMLDTELQRRRDGLDGDYELQFIARSGRRVPMLVTATALVDQEGRYTGSFAVMKDITEQKQAAERLAHLNSVLLAIRNVNQLITRERNADALLQQACECLVETRGYHFAAVLLTEPDGALHACYGAGADLAALAEGVLGAGLWGELGDAGFTPEPRVFTADADCREGTPLAALAAGGALLAIRLEYASRPYGLLVVSTPAEMAFSEEEQSLFAEAAGDLAFALYAGEGESERLRYQAEIAAERDRSQRMLDSAGALIVGLDPSGGITFFNPTCRQVTGFSAQEVMGRPIFDVLIPERERDSVREVFQNLRDRMLPSEFENSWLTHDGHERLIAWHNTPMYDPDGSVREVVGIGLDITEHRAAELAVHESERRYRMLFNSGTDAIFVFGLANDGSPGCFLEANDVACETFGFSREELLRLTPRDLDAPEERETVPDLLRALERDGNVLFEQMHVTRDGRRIPMEVKAHLFTLDGKPTVLSIARDISERRQSAERLAHLNSVLLAIRNVNQLLTRERNPQRLLQQACENLIETRGYHLASIVLLTPEGESSGQYAAGQEAALQELGSAATRRLIWESVSGTAGPAVPVVLGEAHASRSDGIRAEAAAGRACMAIRLEYGERVYGYLATSVPAPMAQSAEEQALFDEVAGDIAFALYASETEAERNAALDTLELTQFSVDHAADGVFWTDPEGRLLYVNEAACRTLGYSREELCQMRVWDVDPQITAERWPETWQKIRDLRTYTFETTQRLRDGQTIPVEITTNYLDYRGQELSFSFARDISLRKQAQAELQRLNHQYRLLVESKLVETFIIQHGRVAFANAAMHERLGYGPGELVGLDPASIVTAEARPSLREWARKHRSGLPVPESFETQVQTARGTVRWVQVWVQDIDDFEGAPAIIGHMVDVTEARDLRTQLEHSQRLEALGTLAGGVAHEFNNVLQAILLNASLLQVNRTLTESEAEKLRTIVERTEYGAQLTDQLLTFSRRTPVQYGPLNMHALLDEARRLLERTVPRTITIKLDGDELPWTVQGDAGRLKQVFINLALNARDAMPNGGEITFQTQNVMLSGAALKMLQRLQPGPHLLIKVRDTGQGMEAQTLSRAFEPFFTTKGVGQGTGLGLSIVHGIVDTHGGDIRVHSKPGEGTTFLIYLPAQPDLTARSEVPVETPSPHGAAERILVVDDETDVAKVASEALASFGYRVATVASGDAALDLVSKQPNVFDLIILDLIMPGLSGQQTLARLLEINPSLRVLIASGYLPQVEKDSLTVGASGYLDKPFSLDRLLETVRGVLDIKTRF